MSTQEMTTADVLKALQKGENVDTDTIVSALKQKASRQAADVVQQFGEHETKTLLVPKTLDARLQSAIKQAGFPNQKAASYTLVIDFIDRVEKGATNSDFLADASMIGVDSEADADDTFDTIDDSIEDESEEADNSDDTADFDVSGLADSNEDDEDSE